MISIVIAMRSLWACKILNKDKKIEVRKGLALYNALKKAEEKGEEVEFLMYVTKAKPCLAKFVDLSHKPSGRLVREVEYITSIDDSSPTSFDLNGKVVARFKAKAEAIKYGLWTDHYMTVSMPCRLLLEKSCLQLDQLDDYLLGGKGTALHIRDLEIFDKPKTLADYGLKRAPESWAYSKGV